MPGNARCLRCGGALQLAAATIRIEPPRASAGAKWLRRYVNGRRWWFWTRAATASAGHNLVDELTRGSVTGGLDLGLLVRSLLPGWAHWHAGYRLRGAIVALVYWPALLAMLSTVGTEWGTFWLGIILAVHAASIIDLLIAPYQTRFERYVLMPMCAAVIVAGLYWPIGYWATSRIFVRRMLAPTAGISSGDVVWFRHLAADAPNVQPGDIVLYDTGNARIRLDTRLNFQVAGDRIDRVIAGPGSRVRWREGHFEVDGQPVPWLPLGSIEGPAEWSIDVPAGCYCIVPSTVPLPNVPRASSHLGQLWTMLAVVPAQHIRGRAFLCGYPPAHWSWLR
jgi:hypothetical protein